MTNNTSPYDLPEQPGLIDPFIRCDGTRLESPGDWLKHRVDLMAMPCHYLYVDLPKRPVKIGVRLEADSEVFDGKAVQRLMTLSVERNGYCLDLRVGKIVPVASHPRNQPSDPHG